nr:PREDICTED: leucine-rich repeat-containing protein 43 isoform X2 [Latimeria chalumnae]|eukprot:XP_014339829.1 PREDICTED: leucine-rich repeat-containing protein 43 isoform X2 [Latimeria chalumnae]
MRSFPLSHFEPKNTKRTKLSERDDEERDVNEEEPADLREYLVNKYSPWNVNKNWGADAEQLRQLAAKAPWLLTDKFIYSYFKVLRIVDKEVCDVDPCLLKFHNLKELVLCSNKIRKVNFANLPKTLKILELCANEISSMKDLCFTLLPPELQHLGLSYNKISCLSEYEYLTADFWPSLICLDLSFNNLVDLLEIVTSLSTLLKLRILLLQGNPLTLIASYRGFTVDSLTKLNILDDMGISPDEKHHFKGMANRKALLEDEASITINIDEIRGIPNPVNSVQLDNEPEFPVIQYNYYVVYEFIRDSQQKSTQKSQELGLNTVSSESISFQSTNKCSFSERQVESVQYSKHPGDGTSGKEITTSKSTIMPTASLFKSADISSFVASYRTLKMPWQEVIECNYEAKHLLKNLLPLRNFLLWGLKLTVVEEKILSWPSIMPESPGKEKPVSAKKKGGKEKETDKSDRESTRDKKKKKQPPAVLQQDPPILKILASKHITLDNLIVRDHFVETVCDFGVLATEAVTDPLHSNEKTSKKGKGKKEDKRNKSGKESAASQKSIASAKGKKKGKGKLEADDMESEVSIQPPSLTVKFKAQLRKWLTAAEALSEEPHA